MDFNDLELEAPQDGNSGMTSYTELNVWKGARALVHDIYVFTSKFPDKETCGLGLQMRNLSICVPSKIAEGAGRKQPKHSLKYLISAKGALFELETMVYIAIDLKYCSEQEGRMIIDKIITGRKLLFGYIRFKERKSNERIT